MGFWASSIDKNNTEGTIAFPDTVSDGTDSYIITEIGNGSFGGCTKITSTGLDNNTTITSVGKQAYDGCIRLQSTGLANNSTIKEIGDYTFRDCRGLQSTGLESNTSVKVVAAKSFEGCIKLSSTGLSENTTVTAIGQMAFRQCTSLVDTGLERNTTVAEIESYAFYECSKLDDIAFEITTLPTMKDDVFRGTGVNIYYLPETTNPEVLNNTYAASINKMAITNIGVNSVPTKTTYIEEQNFDPTGLVLDITYDKIGTKQRSYTDSNFASYFGFDKTELNYGDTSITVTYLDQTITLPITVNKKSVTNIEVKTPPTKVNYIEEEAFNATGLVLTVYYDNGTSEEVVYEESNKEDFIFDKKELRKEDKSIKITYLGKIVELAIKVEVPAEIVVPDKGTEEKVVDTRDTMEILPYLVLSAIASVGILVSKLRKESI